VVLLDPHSEGLAHYLDPPVRTAEISPAPLVERIARCLGGTDFVLASTDAGRAKWVQALAREIGVPAAVAFKRRLAADRTEIAALLADVHDRHVIIYDDMIRSGASMISAACAYRDAGARRISAVATHGVFPEESAARLEKSALFHQFVTTDSHPGALQVIRPWLSIESVGGELAEWIAHDVAGAASASA
jgi:ribose-phosphate pyrophosphokinase